MDSAMQLNIPGFKFVLLIKVFDLFIIWEKCQKSIFCKQ